MCNNNKYTCLCPNPNIKSKVKTAETLTGYSILGGYFSAKFFYDYTLVGDDYFFTS